MSIQFLLDIVGDWNGLILRSYRIPFSVIQVSQGTVRRVLTWPVVRNLVV